MHSPKVWTRSVLDITVKVSGWNSEVTATAWLQNVMQKVEEPRRSLTMVSELFATKLGGALEESEWNSE